MYVIRQCLSVPFTWVEKEIPLWMVVHSGIFVVSSRILRSQVHFAETRLKGKPTGVTSSLFFSFSFSLERWAKCVSMVEFPLRAPLVWDPNIRWSEVMSRLVTPCFTSDSWTLWHVGKFISGDAHSFFHSVTAPFSNWLRFRIVLFLYFLELVQTR